MKQSYEMSAAISDTAKYRTAEQKTSKTLCHILVVILESGYYALLAWLSRYCSIMKSVESAAELDT